MNKILFNIKNKINEFILFLQEKASGNLVYIFAYLSLGLIFVSGIIYIAFMPFLMFTFGLNNVLPQLIACILFVVYIKKFHKEFKCPIVFSIVLGIMALFSFGNNILFLVASIFAIRSAVYGVENKTPIAIAMLIGMISCIINLCIFIFRLPIVYALGHIFMAAGTISLYFAILLFCAKNKIPVLISRKSNKNMDANSPEQTLRSLNYKLEQGMITEEEYQTQRAEIISKL